MRKSRLSARERAEISSLAESFHEALIETVKILRARQAKQLEAKATASR
jgi:hypothetical protein